MALFSSPTYSTMVHNSHNGDPPSSIPLGHAIPSAQSCTISGLIAFPSSLAALKHGIKWNASCWVASQRLNEFEQEQIGLHAFRGEQRNPHIEWCQFATDLNDTVLMLIVFPQLKTSFRSSEVMERWTNNVVLPAFRAIGITDGTLTSDFRIIQMTAEAEREQTLNTFAPDTTLTEILTKKGDLASQDLHTLWDKIQENANKTVFFDGFRNLFLVAVHRTPRIRALPMEHAWQEATITWDSAIDMAFVPVESIQANASAIISAQNIGHNFNSAVNSNETVATRRTGADSLWESSRKRKLDHEDDADKRSKLGLDTSFSSLDDVDMHM